MAKTDVARRLTVGAELQPGGGAHVRVWAPACRAVDLVIPSVSPDRPQTPRVLPMAREADGHFHVRDDDAQAGGRYWFRLEGERLRPDPASAAYQEAARLLFSTSRGTRDDVSTASTHTWPCKVRQP